MPLAEWVARRNNASTLEVSSSTRRLTAQEAQALKIKPDGPFTPGFYARTLPESSPVQSGTPRQEGISAAGMPTDIDAGAMLNPINVFMQTNLARMTQEQRNEAGLGHLQVSSFFQRRASLQSYPSTTSGRVEEDEQDAAFHAPGLSTAVPFSTPARHSLGTGNGRLQEAPQIGQLPHHGARHKQDLNLAFYATQEARDRGVTDSVLGTKRKSLNISNSAQISQGEVNKAGNQLDRPLLPQGNTLQPTQLASSGLARSRSDDTSLDYEPTRLFNMHFKDLQGEPFDYEQYDEITLANKLAATFDKPEEEQAHFFNSLSLGEWEEAGIWFTEKFRELTEKLRHSREQRRELAREFEEEVSKRYDTVVVETNNLDHRLNEMGQKGAQVLAPADRGQQ